MVSIFNNWKQFDKKSQKRIREQLKNIHNTDKLSPDVREIVEKALSQ